MPTESAKPISTLRAAVGLLAATAGLFTWWVLQDDVIAAFVDGNQHLRAAISTPFPATVVAALLPTAFSLIALLAVLGLVVRLRNDSGWQHALRIAAASLLPLGILILGMFRLVPRGGELFPPLALFATTLYPTIMRLCLAAAFIVLLRMTGWQGQPGSSVPVRKDHLWQTAFFAILIAITIPLHMQDDLFSGDQPHYLIITHSLLEDGDIDIEDDHADGAFRAFTGHEELEPQHLVRGRGNTVFPHHKIGMSLLAVPFYALLGKAGAHLFIALFAILGFYLTRIFLSRFIEDRFSVTLATAWMWLSIPMFGLVHQFMTEVPHVTMILAALIVLFRKEEMNLRAAGLVLLFSWTLPWLHTRGYTVAVGLTLILLWRMRRHMVNLATVTVLSIVCALMMPAWNWLLYDSFSLAAQLGETGADSFDFLKIFEHGLALLLDSRFGMILHNPFALLAFAGLLPLWNHSRKLFIYSFIIAGFAMGPGLAYNHWWGGSYPARYIALAMPFLALSLAFWLQHYRRSISSATWYLLGATIALGLLAWSQPEAVNTVRPAPPALLTSISLGPVNATAWWPDWITGSDTFPLAVLLLLGLLGVAFGGAYIFKKHLSGLNAELRHSLGLVLFLLWCSGAALLLPAVQTSLQVPPRTHAEGVMWMNSQRFSENSAVFLDGGKTDNVWPRRGFSAIRLFGRSDLQPDPNAPRGRYMPLPAGDTIIELIEPTPYWAGSYVLDLTLGGNGNATVGIKDIGNTEQAGTALSSSSFRLDSYQTLSLPFRLTENSMGLQISLSSARPLRFASTQVRALDLICSEQWGGPSETFDRSRIRFSTLDLYVPPRMAYPPSGNSVWLQGDSTGTVWLLPRKEDAPISLELFSRSPVRVQLVSARQRYHHSFTEKKRRYKVTLPVDPLVSSGIPLEITVEGSFIPAERVEGSDDTRELGVQLRFVR